MAEIATTRIFESTLNPAPRSILSEDDVSQGELYSGGQRIQYLKTDGKCWVAAKHLVEALGLKWSGPQMIGEIAEEWKGVRQMQSRMGMVPMTVLSQQGAAQVARRIGGAMAQKLLEQLDAEVFLALPMQRK